MVGRAICRRLRDCGHDVITRSRAELDLTNQAQVTEFYTSLHIDQVYVAAGVVGGISANMRYPARFIHDNLAIANNLIHGAFKAGIRNLLYLGSSCIYPRLAPQPMTEESLLGGPLEPTNEPYAIAKIAGIKLCESYTRQYELDHGTDFRSVMPTNLFGPGDNYHPENSHVLPALLQRFHKARINGEDSVTVWGTGEALREFLYVDDLARACTHVMNLHKEEYQMNTAGRYGHINVGTGNEVSIRTLSKLIANVVGFEGEIHFDASRPQGPPRKLLDNSRLRNTGWAPRVSLTRGLESTYADFLGNIPRHREMAHD